MVFSVIEFEKIWLVKIGAPGESWWGRICSEQIVWKTGRERHVERVK